MTTANELIELNLQNKDNWKKLEAYSASYMRDAILEKKKFDSARSAEHMVKRLSEIFPKEEFPSFHALFAVWMEI